jgi:hypothetical protein
MIERINRTCQGLSSPTEKNLAFAGSLVFKWTFLEQIQGR